MPLLNRKNFNPENNLFTMNKTYMASEGNQDNVYQIRKTKITTTNDRLHNQIDKDPADPDPSKGKSGVDKSERHRKYMD